MLWVIGSTRNTHYKCLPTIIKIRLNRIQIARNGSFVSQRKIFPQAYELKHLTRLENR